ncbi:hypothetical protein BDZ85DRAFT_321368 [Elsinoe ampelina]|uniref:Uncharacterized protein n=1 Tax=Elsinoe ampelina TaxID=302913 RepID=A0A6A6G4E2_9PEZI|nr:hypothetical protein BDZ85DRAFT_321368 [Elsinoe ampelina]
MAGTEAIGFVCRSCARRARAIPSSSARSSIASRPFSSTSRSRRSHAVPAFHQECSPELNTILSTIRNDHFLPAYLNDTQERMVFRKKYRSELENSPVSISIEDEDFNLKPLDRDAVEGERKALLKQALELITLEKEWTQLFPFLEGVAKVGNSLDQATVEKLIRKASLEEHFGVILQALKAADRTGLTMKDKFVLRGSIRALRTTAERANWQQVGLNKAIRYADDVAALLSDRSHMDAAKIPRREAVTVMGKPLSRPFNMAVWLELHAVRSYLYGGGKDEAGKIRALYERLMSCYDPEKKPKWLNNERLDISTQFMHIMPLWQGVLLSTKLLGTDTPQGSEQLQAFAAECGEVLSKNVAQLRDQGEHKPGSWADTAIQQYGLARKHIYSKYRFLPVKMEKKKPAKASREQAATPAEE